MSIIKVSYPDVDAATSGIKAIINTISKNDIVMIVATIGRRVLQVECPRDNVVAQFMALLNDEIDGNN